MTPQFHQTNPVTCHILNSMDKDRREDFQSLIAIVNPNDYAELERRTRYYLYAKGDEYGNHQDMMEGFSKEALITALGSRLTFLGGIILSHVSNGDWDFQSVVSRFQCVVGDDFSYGETPPLTLRFDNNRINVDTPSDFFNAVLDVGEALNHKFDRESVEEYISTLPVEDLGDISQANLMQSFLPEYPLQEGIPLSPLSLQEQNDKLLFAIMKSEPYSPEEVPQETLRHVNREWRENLSHLKACAGVLPQIAKEAESLENLKIEKGGFELDGKHFDTFDKVVEAINKPLQPALSHKMKP